MIIIKRAGHCEDQQNLQQFCIQFIVMHLRRQYSIAGHKMIPHWLSSDSGCLKKDIYNYKNWSVIIILNNFGSWYTLRTALQSSHVQRNRFKTLKITQHHSTMWFSFLNQQYFLFLLFGSLCPIFFKQLIQSTENLCYTYKDSFFWRVV